VPRPSSLPEANQSQTCYPTYRTMGYLCFIRTYPTGTGDPAGTRAETEEEDRRIKPGVRCHQVIPKIGQPVHRGNVPRTAINHHKAGILIHIPPSSGAIGALTAPRLAVVGALAAGLRGPPSRCCPARPAAEPWPPGRPPAACPAYRPAPSASPLAPRPRAVPRIALCLPASPCYS
jgi:hypothetical protein